MPFVLTKKFYGVKLAWEIKTGKNKKPLISKKYYVGENFMTQKGGDCFYL
jgi:hypothetical protein